MTLQVRTAPIPDPGPLLDRLPTPGGFVWLRGGEGFVGWGEAARIDGGSGSDRITSAARSWEGLVTAAEIEDPVHRGGSGPVGFATFTFDPRAHGSTIVVPEVVVARSSGLSWLTVAAPRDRHATAWTAAQRALAADAPPLIAHDRTRYAGASMPDLLWLDAVAGAVERIERGGLGKVVLARDHAVWAHAPFDDRVLTHRLAARFPSCFTFCCDGLVGATPELLVRRTGMRVESVPLAGSARRGDDAEADALVGKQLLASDKDRREHEYAAASVREALEPLCAELTPSAEPFLLRLDNVQHLATSFAGVLSDPASVLDVVAALHPTAAVGGTPTAEALAAIRELEGMDRGRYAGPVGWIDGRGDGEFGIALRCAELSGARARLFAGAGIVRDSLPEAELEETRLKLRAMLSAFDEPVDNPPT